MSKVISFSISDKYLEKLRTLYPALTDNLAVKQFVTDGLDGSLGNSLDGSLDDGLDGKLKTLIETSLDGILEGRLDAVVGKSLTSLFERMARLEERLDTNLDGRLDDMELLLRMQREASIASPIPTDETVRQAIETLPTVETVEPISSIETVTDAIEDSEKKIIPLPDTLIASIDGTVETVSTDSSIEPVTDAIGPVRGDSDSIEPVTGEAVNIGDKPWYTIDDLLDRHYPGWPKTKEGLRKKALTECWPRRTRRGSPGKPYEYQAVSTN